jgi:hypothetical protein
MMHLALMAGFGVNFSDMGGTYVLKKMDLCEKKNVCVNDGDYAVFYVISPSSLKLWLRIRRW